MIKVEHADPRDEAITTLLSQSHALMQSLYPADSNHYLSIDELTADNIRFFGAFEHGETLGCGALALKDGYGEIKSMFTDEAARGRGVGDRILTTIETVAKLEGLHCLRLETGNTLQAAHRLYERHGFSVRGPFGDYPEDPLSIFMEKTI